MHELRLPIYDGSFIFYMLCLPLNHKNTKKFTKVFGDLVAMVF